jgi:predicted acetyltransferase
MSHLAIRAGTADDYPAISKLMGTVFHNATGDEEENAAWRAVFEPERSLLAEADDAVVAHAAAFTRDLSVPGGTLPAAHVTMVGVAPSHRRQGLLRRMMQRQLAEVPEPLAVLWASEGRIYPRFGYGLATQRLSMNIDTREVTLPQPQRPGRLRTLTPAGARPLVEQVYGSVRAARPGWSSRNDRWWDKVLDDPPKQRHGATELRATVHEGADGVDGYALWRAKSDWSPGGPQGEVVAKEVVTADPDAYLTLWRFLLSIDLTRSAKLWLGGHDEPLLHLANEPRRLGATLGDGLYVRIVDVPTALTGRRYPAPVEVVLEVTDRLLEANAGRWRLVADGDKVNCVRTDEPADLTCDIVDLGAAYLGGTSLGALAAAGRVREARPGALAAASAGFGWHRAPAGIEIF